MSHTRVARRFGSLRTPGLRRATLAFAIVGSTTAFAAAPANAVTGPYKSISITEPADLKEHTVYQPAGGPSGGTMPVLVWGESGCIANGKLFSGFLSEIASHGILVIANGGPNAFGFTNSRFQDRSIDWAKAQNVKPGGALAGKLEPTRVVAAGHSCGGLENYEVARRRPEVAAIGMMNSGQLDNDQAELDALKVPILYVLGGPNDVAYNPGMADFDRIPKTLPAFLGTSASGHFGTYLWPDGGIYAQTLKDWILWRIKGDTTAAKRFTGTSCGLCTTSGWTVKRRNIS